MVVETASREGKSESYSRSVQQARSDFWNPIPEQPTEYSKSSDTTADFWLPISAAARQKDEASSHQYQTEVPQLDHWWSAPALDLPDQVSDDWGDTATLPWFDPNLSSNPYIISTHRPSELTIAERRGRWLAQLLDIPSARQRRNYARFFAEVFEQFPHRATFAALSDIALSGVEPEALASGCAFRCEFYEVSNLTFRRSPTQRTPFASHDPLSCLSWRRAVRISQLCNGDNPLTHVDVDWYSDWLAVPRETDLYWAYLDYVEWRLLAISLGYLEPHQRTQDRRFNDHFLLGSSSRTGEIFRGQVDHIGVLHAEPARANVLLRRSIGKADTDRKLLDI